jgi:1,4-dihydroxy-2-naphthoate octaprenyltransferase
MPMQRATWLHLRIPFSFFLMPIFLFAWSIAGPAINWPKAWLAFLAIHLFIYPASNGFNSYYDKDERSIGGLRNPPPVSRELLWASLGFDLAGVLLGLLVSWPFALAMLGYGLVSKAYSHPAVRLKKYPVLSLLTIALFQGGFTFLASYHAITGVGWAELGASRVLFPAVASSVMLLGSYPMTQIYQHDEDAKRGDYTFSRLLGIQGTFLYTALVFGASVLGFFYYYTAYYSLPDAVMFGVALAPVLLFFLHWFKLVRQSPAHANYKNTMRLNASSAVCLSLFYLIFYFTR